MTNTASSPAETPRFPPDPVIMYTVSESFSVWISTLEKSCWPDAAAAKSAAAQTAGMRGKLIFTGSGLLVGCSGGRILNHSAARVRLRAVCAARHHFTLRSEEHTSELQSPCNLVCRLLLEKKKQIYDLMGNFVDSIDGMNFHGGDTVFPLEITLNPNRRIGLVNRPNLMTSILMFSY